MRNTFEKPAENSQQKVFNFPVKRMRTWALLLQPALCFQEDLFCRKLCETVLHPCHADELLDVCAEGTGSLIKSTMCCSSSINLPSRSYIKLKCELSQCSVEAEPFLSFRGAQPGRDQAVPVCLGAEFGSGCRDWGCRDGQFLCWGGCAHRSECSS